MERLLLCLHYCRADKECPSFHDGTAAPRWREGTSRSVLHCVSSLPYSYSSDRGTCRFIRFRSDRFFSCTAQKKNCRFQSYSTRVSLTSVFVSELSLHLMTGNIEDRQYSIDLCCSTHLACIVKGRDHPVHVGTTRPSFDCWPVNLSCCSPSLFPLSRESKIFKTLSLSAQLMSSISTLQFSISTLDPSPPLSTDISFLTFKHRCNVLFCWIPLHWSTE